MTFSLAACNSEPGTSVDVPVSGITSTTASTTHTGGNGGTTTTTTVPGPNGPLGDYMYTPDVSTLEFSVEPEDPGDPNFIPGTQYTGPTISFRTSAEDTADFGLWIWDCRVIIGKAPESPLHCDLLLDMMIQNGMTVAYINFGKIADLESLVYDGGVPYSDDMVTEMELRGFIKKCYRYGIRIEMLVGTSGDLARSCLGLDGTTDYDYVKRCLGFVASFNSRADDASERISGIQFDIEPDWNGGEGRAANLQYTTAFLYAMDELFDYYDVDLDFCINAWTERTDQVKNSSGAKVNFLDVLTQTCDTVTIMSYRSNAKEQYDVGRLELSYAMKNGCRLVLGSETMPTDQLVPGEHFITYWNIGTSAMNTEQQLLRQRLAALEYDRVGGAVHHAETFYRLLNERP